MPKGAAKKFEKFQVEGEVIGIGKFSLITMAVTNKGAQNHIRGRLRKEFGRKVAFVPGSVVVKIVHDAPQPPYSFCITAPARHKAVQLNLFQVCGLNRH
jgi:hypothetical protein